MKKTSASKRLSLRGDSSQAVRLSPKTLDEIRGGVGAGMDPSGAPKLSPTPPDPS